MTAQRKPRPAGAPPVGGSQALIRAIHACRRKVEGLAQDDAAWRAFLRQHAGAESLRQMQGRQLGLVLDALHKAGAPRTAGRGAGTDALDQREQARMARGLWIELAEVGAVHDGSEAALGAFVKRQTRKPLRFCTPADLNKVVEALKGWRDRAAAADPMVRVGETLQVPDGWTREQAMIPALWQALVEAGAMQHGSHARLDTWLSRNAGSTRPELLDDDRAQAAALKLGKWLRQHEAAAADAKRSTQREARVAARQRGGQAA